MFRSFFVESAQEINSTLEEEDFGAADQGDDFDDDVSYGDDLDESFDDEDELHKDDVEQAPAVDDAPADDDDIDQPADDFPVDGGDEPVAGDEDTDAELPTPDEWAEITSEFDDLAALFAELGVGEDDDEDTDGDDDFGGFDQPEQHGDDGLDFDEPAGEEHDPVLGEDYGFEAPAVDNSDKASCTKSNVAPEATSIIDGVDPLEIKSTKDAEIKPAVKVDDHSNIQKTGKDIYKQSTEKGAGKDTVKDKSVVHGQTNRPMK